MTMSTITETIRRFLGGENDKASGPVQAIWNGVVVAESDRTVRLEGNHDFPPGDLKDEYLEPSGRRSFCPWKGQARYYDLVDGERNRAATWYYPRPSPAARRVKDH